ncbi:MULTISPECIES: sirohydrochlorin chelatase [Streptacidiphilus]|uniref:Sirohydrochlorin chelatase n=1 Tax=Streptacidiphilus cavernicola TaxID=3342716 RepID=A0ABV6UQJ7_9ACTN|nr:sirohydrochlorin chelatase [Streptacidiphilus jeojiense]
MTTGSTLLLVAHGSRDPRHAATVTDLAALVRAQRPDLPVEVGYLDHCAPRIPQVLESLGGRPVAPPGEPAAPAWFRDQVVAIPLLLNHAFHARSDIPAVLAEAASRQHGLTVRQGAVLGPSPLLLDALDRRLAEAGVRPSARTGVVLAAAGSSDPAANAVTREVAADWQRTRGWGAVEVAHASAAPPRVADAVAALRARGLTDIAVAPYLLAPGLLPDRIAAEASAAGVDTVAAPLGATPELARLLLRRHDEALRTATRRASLAA